MATAAPFVKLLRQLATAKDDYRTGALDITWEGGKASIFLVFGQPNHAVLETAGGERLEGMAALTALVRQLPPRFDLSPWRKEVVRTETLGCTLEELMEPFVQLAGAASPGRVEAPAPEAAVAPPAGHANQPDFGLADFPLLPLGPSLWADAAASVVHLDTLIPNLPDALIVLTGPKLRAAALVVRQHLIDAVWVDAEERTMGETAAMALMGAREGSVSGYRLEEPGLGEALTMLWRCPAVYREMPTAWINAESLLADLEGGRRNAAIVVTGGARGVALVADGALIGVYTESERQPLSSPERLAELLGAPEARITLRQRREERSVDHLPETAYHAFVGGADAAPAESPPQGLAALPASGRDDLAADPGPDRAVATPPAVPSSAAAASAPAVWVTPTERAPMAPAMPAVAAAEVPAEPRWSSPPTAGPGPAAEAPAGRDEVFTTVSAAASPPAPTPSLPFAPPTTSPAADAAPPATPPSPGPARFSDYVASQGLDELGGPPPHGPNFDTVKADLIQIGALWLGTDGVAPIAEMILTTKPTIAALMATIDAIKGVELPGQESSVVQAMAREMHYHAAEYLSGL